ncbi:MULTISPECIES: hypothetical protein [unclassified Streptomyces]|uniref:hypothetical protein n=1 Tax=unclassified Streptomyces TaxID=2593676 RepID=UPI000B89FE3B|nr:MULTISPECIES: hypothetical protein [unclassified Streptomyces]MYS20216.1 hypothetical protein [Streptomyces sp. SID4948]
MRTLGDRRRLARRIWLLSAAVYLTGVVVSLVVGDPTGWALAWPIASAVVFAGSGIMLMIALRRTETMEERQR